jgi:DNA-binding response OmpR family regulator
MLPKIPGLEICKKLREAGNHTPILILTAMGEIDDRVVGLNSGADDYLVKPFAFTELLARIKALNRRPVKSTGAILRIDDLSLNTLTYEVKRSDKSINLSKKEYALLEYMIRHPNVILTKDQLINNVWDYEADILPNTVEVYIGYLRNKIDRPFKKSSKLIQTIRGFGYKIEKGK